MFDLIRFVCELTYGSSLCLSHECFDYLSFRLKTIVIQLIQQSFSTTLRCKRTRLLGDDLQLALKYRAISPLYGYCCTTATDKTSLFETTYQLGRVLFSRADRLINLHDNNDNRKFQPEKARKMPIIVYDDIFLHVEWLAIAGEQTHSLVESLFHHKSLFNVEQQLYLSLLRSNNFNEEVWSLLRHDQTALDSVLPSLIEWCRNDICECLIHSSRLKKRRQLAFYLTIINCLLHNSLTTINHYLHILSSVVMNCLLYEFETDERFDCDEEDLKSPIDTGHLWSLRLLASQACVKMLERSDFLVYDLFYTRIIAQLIYSVTNIKTASSVIYAILRLFEQLGCHACRSFLLSYLPDIDSSKILASKLIHRTLERIISMISATEKFYSSAASILDEKPK